MGCGGGNLRQVVEVQNQTTTPLSAKEERPGPRAANPAEPESPDFLPVLIYTFLYFSFFGRTALDTLTLTTNPPT